MNAKKIIDSPIAIVVKLSERCCRQSYSSKIGYIRQSDFYLASPNIVTFIGNEQDLFSWQLCKNSENIISCKVIKSVSNDKAIIDFNGYGLIVSLNEKADFVNVKYTGNIGTPDFKYEVV